MFNKLIFLFFIILVAGSATFAISCNDNEDNIIGILYPKSYDVHKYKSSTNDILNVTYKVKLLYPSKDVLSYYDNKLNDIGWLSFVQPAFRDREWHSFIDETQRGAPLVHQLLATWVNRDKKRMIVLGLKYYSTKLNVKEKHSAKKPDNDIQEVTLQIMPFIILPDISAR
jgi:hypothetical protein